MALKGSGRLLIRLNEDHTNAQLAAKLEVTFDGYQLEPLSTETRLFALTDAPRRRWMLASPQSVASLSARAEKDMAGDGDQPSPWDEAHRVAAQSDYVHFVEPDIEHERPDKAEPVGMLAATDSASKFKPHWPPFAPNADVSPAWHLLEGYTGFDKVRAQSTGRSVRIAHLDTGYTDNHPSKPRNLNPGLGYDYWDNDTQPIDSKGGLQSGHGTATLALLAGTSMVLTQQSQTYTGDFGGAPDAEVVPIRISSTVIHLYTRTMAKGIRRAVEKKCDVVSISHGGLPSQAWADAVNDAYRAGIVIVAASGDSVPILWRTIHLVTHHTVYPSAFNRVITAVGATYDRQPYVAKHSGDLQGCWGPATVMEKAIAAYTPNVVWMDYDQNPNVYDLDGGGTSASTPQIAAACALWLDLYGNGLTGWKRVEACRLALFSSAAHRPPDKTYLGHGILDVPSMLEKKRADASIANANGPAAEDDVSFPFWRLLLGFGPPNSEENRMYELEVAQVILQSDNPLLKHSAGLLAEGRDLTPISKGECLDILKKETLSNALRKKLENV